MHAKNATIFHVGVCHLLAALKLSFTCSQLTTFQNAAMYSGRRFWYLIVKAQHAQQNLKKVEGFTL